MFRLTKQRGLYPPISGNGRGDGANKKELTANKTVGSDLQEAASVFKGSCHALPLALPVLLYLIGTIDVNNKKPCDTRLFVMSIFFPLVRAARLELARRSTGS